MPVCAPSRDGVSSFQRLMSSIRLRESYLKQQIQIQKMRERIKELESLTSLISKKERLEFQREYHRQHDQEDMMDGTDAVSPAHPPDV